MNIKEKLLWLGLLLSVLVIMSNSLLNVFTSLKPIPHVIVLGLPVLVVVSHMILTLSVRRAILFISLASVIGFSAETLGVNYGIIFGGFYKYQLGGPYIGMVPLAVILYWNVFIYMGYCLTNLVFGQFSEKSGLRKLIIPIISDGLIVMCIDLFMDPIQVKQGDWFWIYGGEYFYVPLQNFVGWFLVTILVSGIYRLLDCLYPRNQKYDYSLRLIPVIGYFMVIIGFTALALKLKLISLIFIGNVIMLPILCLCLAVYFKNYNLPSDLS